MDQNLNPRQRFGEVLLNILVLLEWPVPEGRAGALWIAQKRILEVSLDVGERFIKGMLFWTSFEVKRHPSLLPMAKSVPVFSQAILGKYTNRMQTDANMLVSRSLWKPSSLTWSGWRCRSEVAHLTEEGFLCALGSCNKGSLGAHNDRISCCCRLLICSRGMFNLVDLFIPIGFPWRSSGKLMLSSRVFLHLLLYRSQDLAATPRNSVECWCISPFLGGEEGIYRVRLRCMAPPWKYLSFPCWCQKWGLWETSRGSERMVCKKT